MEGVRLRELSLFETRTPHRCAARRKEPRGLGHFRGWSYHPGTHLLDTLQTDDPEREWSALSTEQATPVEAEVKRAVERFLDAIGRYDLDAVAEMFTDEASIGAASISNGQWATSTLPIREFLARLRSDPNPTHYKEPVSDFVVLVDDGRLAFVRADATLVIDNEPRRHNIDYFTLMNLDGTWKFISASYVSKPID